MESYILDFNQINLESLPEVGGKNASLGEMFQNLSPKGIVVPDGFATTSEAYWDFLYSNKIRDRLAEILGELNTSSFSNLSNVGEKARQTVLDAQFSREFKDAVSTQYEKLESRVEGSLQVAVRSSATAEDLPDASFAGQQETYLNVSGIENVLDACKRCFASLFTDRAIKYREDKGFDHMKVALSVGIQQMVRADKGCSGIAFTIDPNSGFSNVISIASTWGLGENIVQGNVDPDEFLVYKPNLQNKLDPIISKKVGKKKIKMIYPEQTNHHPDTKTVNVDTSEDEQVRYTLDEDEIIQLAQWCLIIEQHYDRPMDIEWAQDGITGELYIVQARPETVHANRDPHLITNYTLKASDKPLLTGVALGNKIASGKARIIDSPKDADKLAEGEVLVTGSTDPDWDPIMKKAAAIITERGGRTSHAAIVARELGVVAIVGAEGATKDLKDGQEVTVSCAEGNVGKVYAGKLDWEESAIDTSKVSLPDTHIMLILADPDNAFTASYLPGFGVGLMRLEFVINNTVKTHPMALVQRDKVVDDEMNKEIDRLTINHKNPSDYFVDQLSYGVATMAAAFYPREIIVRMSDFKSNEYKNLLGGEYFEPDEENPMIGFRGASRYCSDEYKDAFALECRAMKKVREEMGFQNIKLMIPFCRTVEEADKVIQEMKNNGLARGENDLELYMMVEIPSNVLLAKEFASRFDGFSIGSNDLTQLTLGVDRDNDHIRDLFDENNQAVKTMIEHVVKTARESDITIGLCGQAPSDDPSFAQFLVDCGIDSISFNQDALIDGIENINRAEEKKTQKTYSQGPSTSSTS